MRWYWRRVAARGAKVLLMLFVTHSAWVPPVIYVSSSSKCSKRIVLAAKGKRARTVVNIQVLVDIKDQVFVSSVGVLNFAEVTERAVGHEVLG